MRKTSRDGGDSTSITSGIENEMKKCGPGILKSTKNSIKRKVQNFSNESDDTANEPLLHKDKEKSEIEKQSAKFLISKTKTDYASEKGDDKDKLLANEKITKPSITDVTGITDAPIGNGVKDHNHVTFQSIFNASIHNHMNTNIFHSPDVSTTTVIAKTQILVELDTSKPTRYSPSPLIFTTAKIHTDGNLQQMEPVQVTPIPILSTIEGGLGKTETKAKVFGSQQTKEKQDISVTTPVTRVATISKLPEKHDINVTSNEDVSNNISIKLLPFGGKSLITDNKNKISAPTQNGSEVISSKTTAAQISNSTAITEDSFRTKTSEPLSKNYVGTKLVETPIRVQDLQNVSRSNDFCSSEKKEFTKIPAPTQITSAADRSNVDINKNFQSQPKLDSEAKKDDEKTGYKASSIVSSTKGFSSDLGAKADKTSTVSNTNDSNSIYYNQDSELKLDSEAKKDDEKTDYKASSNVSSTKGFSSDHGAKADKTSTVSNTNDSKSIYNNQDSQITTSKVITSVKEHSEYISPTENVAKLSPTALSGIGKANTVKLTESSVYKTDTSLLGKSTPITTNSSITKSSVKNQTNELKGEDITKVTTQEAISINKFKSTKLPEGSVSKTTSLTATSLGSTIPSSVNKSNVSSTKPIEIVKTNKVDTAKSPGGSISKTESSLPTTSLSSTTNKSISKDKEYSALASKTTSKEETAQKRLASDTKTASDVSRASIAAPSSTKSTVSVSPQITPNLKTAPNVNKSPSVTNNTGTTTSTPVTSANKTSVSSNVSPITDITSSKTSSIVKTTADDVVNKYKSNNVATVVSLISKATAPASNTKSTLPSSSIITSKTPLSVKQSTSPSTVKTISSIPTVKSSIVSSVPHEKKSTKGVSTSVNESMSSVSNTKSVSSSIKNPITTKDNTVKVTPRAKIGETSSSKVVTKSSSQSDVKPREDVKDNKGSKA